MNRFGIRGGLGGVGMGEVGANGTGMGGAPAAPWDRQPGESEKAYAAFLAFRDLGPGRTIRDAYRQRSGNASAIQAPGYFSAWASEHRWADRAAAWDRDVERCRMEGAQEAAHQSGALWAERREAEAEAALAVGRRLMARADRLAGFPVVSRKQVELEDGTVTIVEPLDSTDLARASLVAVRAYALIRAAIDHASPPDRMPEGWQDFDPATCDDLATLERFIEAARR